MSTIFNFIFHIAEKDETYTILYTNYRVFSDVIINNSSEVSFILDLNNGTTWDEHEYIRFINQTDEKISKLSIKFYASNGLAEPDYVCTYVLSNIDVNPGESIVMIRNYHFDSSYYNIGLLVKYKGLEYAYYSQPNALKEAVNYYYDWIDKKYGG